MAENTLRSFATMGFGPINRYNRHIQAKRAIRDLHRIISKGEAFDTFIKEAQREGITRNEVISLARKAGMRGEQGAYLAAHAGIVNPETFRLVATEFLDIHGLDQEKLQAAINKHMIDGKYRKARTLQRAAHQMMGFLQFVNNTVNLEPRMLTKAIPKTVVEELISSLLQFPALALHQSKTMFRMGGYGGLTMWLLSFMLGETFYATLREMVRGKSWTEIQQKWIDDPAGSMLQVAEKVPFMGNFAIFQELAVYGAVQMARKLNPDMLSGYDSNPRANGFGIAGFGMLQNKVATLFRGLNAFASGEMEEGDLAKLFVNLAPIPFSQLSSLALNQYYPEEIGLSGGRSSGSPGRTNRGNGISETAGSNRMAQQAALRDYNASYQPDAGETPETASEGSSDEASFRDWWQRNPDVKAWRKQFVRLYGEEPDPNTRHYDYRKAWKAGEVPQPNPNHVENGEEIYHWSSIGKSEDHPTMWKEKYMQKTGKDPDAVGATKDDWLKMQQGSTPELADELDKLQE
jgi:hypothetical protein